MSFLQVQEGERKDLCFDLKPKARRALKKRTAGIFSTPLQKKEMELELEMEMETEIC